MGIKEIALELCKRESKKRQVDVAQMYEILGQLCDLIWDSHGFDDDENPVLDALVTHSIKRNEKGKR